MCTGRIKQTDVHVHVRTPHCWRECTRSTTGASQGQFWTGSDLFLSCLLRAPPLLSPRVPLVPGALDDSLLLILGMPLEDRRLLLSCRRARGDWRAGEEMLSVCVDCVVRVTLGSLELELEKHAPCSSMRDRRPTKHAPETSMVVGLSANVFQEDANNHDFRRHTGHG